MNIPNLPTDNLYKFIALFGLILTLSTLYLDSEARKELTLLYNQQLNVGFENLAGDIDRANENKIELDSMKSVIESWKDSTYIITSENDKLIINDRISKFLDEEEVKIKRILDSYYLNERLFKLKLEANNKLIESQITDKQSHISKLLFITICSFVLMCTGFIYWYFKTQLILDIENKLRLLKANKELDNYKQNNEQTEVDSEKEKAED